MSRIWRIYLCKNIGSFGEHAIWQNQALILTQYERLMGMN